MDATLPENLCGRPVRDASFYGWEPEIDRLWRRLETDHVLLTAPRRVGKTSMMYALAANAPERDGWLGAVYFSAEDAVDEADFVARLYAEVSRTPRCDHVAHALTRTQRKSVIANVSKLSAGPLAVELWQQAKEEWTGLAAEFEDSVMGLPPGRKLLLIVDELPVFLIKLRDQDPTRARNFLAWFRALRQGRPGRSDDLRWLVAGSIGLGPLAARERWTAHINDLHSASIGAFDQETAAGLVGALSTRYRLGLSAEAVAAVVARIGWPIPYFLQLMVAELRDLARHPADIALVETAFENLLTTNVSKNFGPWWERLPKELGTTDAAAAEALLSACAHDPAGASLAVLRGVVEGFWPEAERDSRRQNLLEVLEHDGYLVHVGTRWCFRSPLLQAVWLRRLAR